MAPAIETTTIINDDVNGIVKVVCDYMRVDVGSLPLKNRKRHLVTTRHLVAYFLRQHCPFLTFTQIANFMGQRDHSTAIYGAENITRLNQYDFDIKRMVADISIQISKYKKLNEVA